MDPHAIEQTARKHGIRLLLQFGSAATGRMHPLSDVDLAVLLERAPESFAALADLITDLQALVPGREVDVAVINHADPLLLKRVTGEGVLLYGPRRLFHDLKIYAYKRYQDHRRFFDMERDYVAQHLPASGR